MSYFVDENGYYGQFGGAYIPEMLYPNVEELRKNYLKIMEESSFQEEFNALLKDYVGFVPLNVLDKKPSPENAISITCGPPIMIKFVIKNLQALGFKDEQIYTTVENKMKCGIGKCGRCNIGLHYVCKDGPVYSWAELKNLPQEY